MNDGSDATGGAPAILCIFAHPDDEQFGTAGALRACVERGIAVHILSATRGDAGEISDPALATRETLAAVRTEELREACRILGFADPILLDFGDGRLAEADGEELQRTLVATIRRIRPRVVITFDANGGYGHLDHIAIHRATLAAVDAAADPAYAPDLGAPHAIAKLYATAYPRPNFEKMREELAAHGAPTLDFSNVQTIPAEELGTPVEAITTAVNVDDHWDVRWPALLAHRTQFGPESPFRQLPEPVVRNWMANDYFRRLRPAPAPGATLPDEHDLWEGIA